MAGGKVFSRGHDYFIRGHVREIIKIGEGPGDVAEKA